MPAIRWLPLESNPDVMNKFLEQLGVPINWGISDIISLDEELLSMVPGPVQAVLLLFPISEGYTQYSKDLEEAALSQDADKDVFFMYQTIGNACGTIALIHAVANSLNAVTLASESVLQKFLDEAKNVSPKDRANLLEENDDISAAHVASAEEGQTEPPPIDENVNLHFIAIVNVNNKLYELDGRKSCPIQHGETKQATFLEDAAKVCKGYMERDPENLNFTALAFGGL